MMIKMVNEEYQEIQNFMIQDSKFHYIFLNSTNNSNNNKNKINKV